MSYKQCLSNALNEGTINKKQYDEQLELIDNLERTYKGQGLNPTEASIEAAKKAYDTAKIAAAYKKRNNRLKIAAQQRIEVNLKSYRNAKGEEDYAGALKAIFARDDSANFASLETVIQQEYAIVQKYLDSFLHEFKYGQIEKVKGVVGIETTKRKTLTSNFMKALFGEETTDKLAQQLAKAWTEASELARQRFNKYGGRIAKLTDWRIPQSHDFIKIRKVAADTWTDFILPLLKVDKMIDQTTGLAFTPQSIRLALREVYETLSLDGTNKLLAKDIAKRKSATNQRLDHRFLIFKDSESWLKYQDKFGKGDNVLAITQDHLMSLTRDTALKRVLGPDDEAGYLYAKTLVKQKAARDARQEAQGSFKRKTLAFKTEDERAEAILGGGLFESGVDNLYMLYKGQLNRPSDKPWARGLAGIRQLLTSAYLGSASIVALTDFNWQRITNQFNDLPAFKSARRTLSLWREGLLANDKTIGKVAVRSGLIAESWTTFAHQQSRFFIENNGMELTQRLADATISLSGLSGMTQAGRWGFGMELMGFFADNANKSFSELDKLFQRGLKRYGISEGDWDIIRKTKLYDAAIDDPKMAGKNVVFLRPDDIRGRTDIPEVAAEDLATKLYDFIKTETEFAVPSVSAKGRAWILGNAKPGTFTGELILSAAMFKQFPITLMFTHIARGLAQTGFPGKFRYMGDLMITGAMYGAFTMEVREITKGRQPTPLEYIKENPGEYFLRALITGGGLGLFGDYFVADHNRYGKTISETIPGPLIQFIADLYGLSVGNVLDLIRGEEANFTGDSLKFIKRNTPGASIWYLRLLWERVIMDTVGRMVDVDFDSKNSRQINNYLRNTQQEFWWQPGEIMPSEAPYVPFSK
jgi:hypothetical protein